MTFETFVDGDNGVIVEQLKQICDAGRADSQIALWGSTDSGKTHLLTAVCERAAAQGYRIAYLSAEMIDSADVLHGLEGFDLVALDDMQNLPRLHDSELAIFSLINGLRERDGALLMAADRNISELTVELPDLRTRLHWGGVFALSVLAQDDIKVALSKQAAQAGLEVGDDVLSYLLNHYPRDIRSQTRLLMELDTASMQTGRRLTIPLIREVFSTENT